MHDPAAVDVRARQVSSSGESLYLVECKSGATIHPSFFEPLLHLSDAIRGPAFDIEPALVYGGAESHPRRSVPVYSWMDIERLGRRIAG